MVRLELQLELAYDIEDPEGADFVFNIHAAQTAHQTVEGERLVLNQDITPEVATDPATASRFMRLHAGPGPLHLSYSATINILHHRAEPDALAEVPMRCLPLDVMQYVYPSRSWLSTNSADCGRGTAGCSRSSTGCRSGSPSPPTPATPAPPRWTR
jgi:hypothetical protein